MEKIELVCFSTARSESTSVAAMAALLLPWRHLAEHLELAGGEPVELGARRPGRRHQGLDHPRVDDRPAGRHLADGGEQLVDVADPLLQQVGPPARALVEEREGVGRLGVLAEHDDADVGRSSRSVAATWMPSSVPVGGMRMSVTTTSGASRPRSARAAGQVAGGADEVDVVRALEQPGDALAQQRVVLRQHDSHRHRPYGEQRRRGALTWQARRSVGEDRGRAPAFRR